MPDLRRAGWVFTGVRIRRNAGILRTYGALKPTPRTVQTLLFNKEADNFTYDIANEDDAFRDFCAERGLRFRLFRECPLRHFYPGAGIGLAVTPQATATTAAMTSPTSSSRSSG